MNDDQMLEVLKEAKVLLNLPDNDFGWSRWRDADAAITEIDTWAAAVSAGEIADTLDLEVLFAPTGPIQEVSLSSGWGQRFLEVAQRFDAALKQQAEQAGATNRLPAESRKRDDN